MCFWQNREVFSFPGRRSILYSQPSWQESEREEEMLFSRLSVSFRTPATQGTQATTLVISHIRYTSIKILQGFLVIFLYLIWFSLCSSLFWELSGNGVKIYNFVPKAPESCQNFNVSKVDWVWWRGLGFTKEETKSKLRR